TNVELVLDDEATASLPDEGPLVSGRFKPTNIGIGDHWYRYPFPDGAGMSVLSMFDGRSARSVWGLYVIDDTPGNGGSIASWDLEITTAPAPSPPCGGQVTVPAGPGAGTPYPSICAISRPPGS